MSMFKLALLGVAGAVLSATPAEAVPINPLEYAYSYTHILPAGKILPVGTISIDSVGSVSEVVLLGTELLADLAPAGLVNKLQPPVTLSVALTNGDDIYVGQTNDTVYNLWSMGGNDNISLLGSGNHRVVLGQGNVNLDLGAGNSTVWTTSGQSTVRFGAGSDTAVSALLSKDTFDASSLTASNPTKFNELYYLGANSDVLAAVKDGRFASGLDHYDKHGASEGRNPNAHFDEKQYLVDNPDVAMAIKAGPHFKSGFDHFQKFGFGELRRADSHNDGDVFYINGGDTVKTGGVDTSTIVFRGGVGGDLTLNGPDRVYLLDQDGGTTYIHLKGGIAQLIDYDPSQKVVVDGVGTLYAYYAHDPAVPQDKPNIVEANPSDPLCDVFLVGLLLGQMPSVAAFG